MNKRKIIMLLTVLIVTILTASGFYLLESETNPNAVVVDANSNPDYEIVEASDGPYINPKTGNKCYVRYNGNKTHRTIVDIADDLSKTGKINGIKITNTYKMFSYKSDADNTAVTRVFVPASIAIEPDKDETNTYEYKGISPNMFEGYNQNIDLIYHTGEITNKVRGEGIDSSYDKTQNIDLAKSPNVNTYVYLGDENLTRIVNKEYSHEHFQSDYFMYGYIGKVLNAYVSKEVVSLDCLFRSSGEAGKVSVEMNKVIVDEEGTWTTALCMFEGETHLEELPSNFNLPKTVTEYWGLFCNCENLKNLPASLKFNDNAFFMSSFRNCRHLRGLIEFPETTMGINDSFIDAGIEASQNVYGYNTPIVLKYYESCQAAVDVTDNILMPSQSGYVTKVPIRNQSGWEKVSDNTGGRNSDDDGINKYHLHYKGSEKIIDLNDTNTYPLTSDGYPAILGTKAFSTVKMFSENQTISRVFMPASIAITADGIAGNTFENCNQSYIDLIYHTGEISNKVRGEGIDSSYDKTKNIDSSKSPNVNTYVYLGDENLTRIANKEYSHEHFQSDYFLYGYIGKVLNAYVSKEVVSLDCLFRSSAELGKASVEMNKVLVDEEGSWTTALCMFEGETHLEELPSNFNLPKTVTEYWGIFCNCESLKSLPASLKFNDNAFFMSSFYNCTHLRGIIELPKTTLGIYNSFENAGTAEGLDHVTNYNTPLVIRGYSDCQVFNEFNTNIYDATTNPNGKVTKEYIYGANSLIKESQSAVSIDTKNKSEGEESEVLETTNKKIIIEDETDWVIITVNKKTVDDVVDETQTNSQSIETVTDESTKEEDEVQE